MKILKVIPFFTPQMGGSAEVAYQLSAHLTQLGHEVTILTTDYGQETSRFPEGGCEVICIPNLAAGFGFYFSPKIIPWASKNLASFDIVHLYTTRTFQNVVAHHYCQKQHIPYILSPHGTLPIIMQRQIPKQVFDLLIGKKIIHHASCFHAVSQIEYSQYKGFSVNGEDITLIPNGIELLERNINNIEYLKEKMVDKDSLSKRMILFLGRIHLRKRVELLINAFAQLSQNNKDIYLVIAGPDEGEVENLKHIAKNLGISPLVKFIGPVYGEDKWCLLAACHILVNPAVKEIFGLVPFEAIQCGVPVIVSDDSGSGEIIKKWNAGYLFKADNQTELSETISFVLSHPNEAQQRVKNGQDFIKNHLIWATIAYDYLNLYRHVVLESKHEG